MKLSACLVSNFAMGTGETDVLLWTVELEVSLFHAMRNLKPVGMFHTALICSLNYLQKAYYLMSDNRLNVYEHKLCRVATWVT